MGIKTTPWNSAEYLKTEEDIQLYLEACLDEAGEDPQALIHALNVIACAKKMSKIEQDFSQTTDESDPLIAPDSSPTFATVAKYVNALGFKLTVEPIT